MKYLMFLLFLSGCTVAPVAPVAAPDLSQATPILVKPMVAGYYAGWNSAKLPPSQIDFSTITQLQNFSAVPNVDGTLNITQNHLNPDVVALAQKAGVKVLLTIGSSATAPGFRGAMANLPKFVANIVALAATYDGVDLDWEPLEITDYPAFTQLVVALRAAIPTKILAVAIGDYPDPTGKVTLMKSLPQIDQINLMTYDLAGPWSGWVTYHDSATYSYGPPFIRTVDSIVTKYLAAGIDPKKIAFGVDFDGKLWTGVSKPLDTWATAPIQTDISYTDAVAKYGVDKYYSWDVRAQAAYYSGPNVFVTFDNAQSIQAKLAYAKLKGLHGVTIWDMASGSTLLQEFKK